MPSHRRADTPAVGLSTHDEVITGVRSGRLWPGTLLNGVHTSPGSKIHESGTSYLGDLRGRLCRIRHCAHLLQLRVPASQTSRHQVSPIRHPRRGPWRLDDVSDQPIALLVIA